MKRIFSLLLCVALLVGMVSVLTACKSDDDGAYISVYLSDVVYDLDPTEYYADDNAAQLMSLIYEPLFSLNKRGKLQKAAAEKYEIDKEKRTIVIELRESYWSNGARVSADDFIYAWRDRILSPSRANAAAPLLYDIENALEIKQGKADINSFGAMRTGVYEITIQYREGADPEQILKNLASVATAPVYQPTVSAAPNTWSKLGGTCTTNGPFQISLYDTDDAFSLVRNNGYHQPSTSEKLDKFVTPHTLASFWAGENKIDLTYEQIQNKVIFFIGNVALSDRAANVKKATVVDLPSTYSYVFNTENPLFADAKVRYALSLAVDRGAIVEAVTYGEAACGYLPSCLDKDFETKVFGSQANLELAKQTLAEANIPEGVEKKFNLTVAPDAESVKIAELVIANWAALGFEVTMKIAGPVTAETVNDSGSSIIVVDSGVQKLLKEASMGVRNYDCLALDLQMYSNDPFVALCAFTSDMNGNGVDFTGASNTPVARKHISGFVSAEYDALIKEAFTKSGNERETLLKQAEEMLVKAAPIVPLLYNRNAAYISKDLSNVEIDGYGHFVFTEATLKNYQKYLPSEEE